jgi:hypothetical protein
LGGVEVDHVDQDMDERDSLCRLARDLDLIITGSSDYHGAGKAGHHLGTHTTAPDQYQRIIELAADTARAAGRIGPRPIGAGAA